MGVGKIYLGALAYVVEYRKSLLQALLIPVILSAAIDFVQIAENNTLYAFVLSIIQAVLNTLILVNIHRIVLLGPDSVPKWGMEWTRRESLFLLHMFMLILIGFSIFILTTMLISTFGIEGVYVFIIAGLIVAYVVSRFFLVLPAIAVDQRLSLMESWRLTKQRQFLTMLVVFVFPTLLMLGMGLLAYIPYIEYLLILLLFVLIVVTITAVSVTYKILSTSAG